MGLPTTIPGAERIVVLAVDATPTAINELLETKVGVLKLPEGHAGKLIGVKLAKPSADVVVTDPVTGETYTHAAADSPLELSGSEAGLKQLSTAAAATVAVFARYLSA